MSDIFKKASTTFDTRVCFTEIHGDYDSGKTTLALTAPGPIALISTGEKVDGILQQAAKVKDIRWVKFSASFKSLKKGKNKAQEIMDQANVMMDCVEEAWFGAYDTDWCKSLVIDAHPDVRNLLLYASFGHYKPVMGTTNESGDVKGNLKQDWGPVNARWFSLINAHRAQNLENDRAINLILVGETKAIWKGFDKTDKTEPVCHDLIVKKADIILRTSDKSKNRNKREFTAKVVKGWANVKAKGKIFNVMIGEEEVIMQGAEALPYIWGRITETDPEEWT